MGDGGRHRKLFSPVQSIHFEWLGSLQCLQSPCLAVCQFVKSFLPASPKNWQSVDHIWSPYEIFFFCYVCSLKMPPISTVVEEAPSGGRCCGWLHSWNETSSMGSQFLFLQLRLYLIFWLMWLLVDEGMSWVRYWYGALVTTPCLEVSAVPAGPAPGCHYHSPAAAPVAATPVYHDGPGRTGICHFKCWGPGASKNYVQTSHSMDKRRRKSYYEATTQRVTSKMINASRLQKMWSWDFFSYKTFHDP